MIAPRAFYRPPMALPSQSPHMMGARCPLLLDCSPENEPNPIQYNEEFAIKQAPHHFRSIDRRLPFPITRRRPRSRTRVELRSVSTLSLARLSPIVSSEHLQFLLLQLEILGLSKRHCRDQRIHPEEHNEQTDSIFIFIFD